MPPGLFFFFPASYAFLGAQLVKSDRDAFAHLAATLHVMLSFGACSYCGQAPILVEHSCLVSPAARQVLKRHVGR